MRKLVTTIGFLTLVGQAARAEQHVRIDYVLPSVTVTAGVAQRITKCPPSADDQVTKGETDPDLRVEFAYTVMIAGKMKPRRLVQLDTESGFLVDRETKIHFNDDWYLKDFNGKTTGQGGALVVSLIKAAAGIYGMTANSIHGIGKTLQPALADFALGKPKPPVVYKAKHWYLECTASVTKSLAELGQREEDVAALEARTVAGDVSAATQALLTLRRSQVEALKAKLTINAPLKKGLTPIYDGKGQVTNLLGTIEPPDISPWFQLTQREREVKSLANRGDQPKPQMSDLLAGKLGVPGGLNPYAGLYGYALKVTPEPNLTKWFGCDGADPSGPTCAARVIADQPLPTRDLVYLRPIPANAKLWPCSAKDSCADDGPLAKIKDASGSSDVKLPQLSRLYSMRTGGSIFGGRTVGAEFGSMGEPTMLQYNIGSSGKDVAGILDASIAAAQSIRDAPGAATKRELDQLKNAKDLQALLDELDKSTD